jgi:hypothetical protein
MTTSQLPVARPVGRRWLVFPLVVILSLRVIGPTLQSGVVGSYFSDQTSNFQTYGRDTIEHPGSVIQNTLGLLLGMGTSGRRAEGYGGNWVYYEYGKGLGPLIPHLFGRESITVGNFVFSAGPLRYRAMLYWHEYRHYQQSTEHGLLFIPAYLRSLLTQGYEGSTFERDADRWAWRMRWSKTV